MQSFSITDIGRKRKMNQDFVYASDERKGSLPNLYIVADGMGGHKAGDFASRYAVTETVRRIEEEKDTNIRDVIDISLHHVNEGLHRISLEREELEGCGTTIVIACISENTLHVANVGDSRLYIAGKNSLRQITVDHSLVQEMVMNGTLSSERARTHPEKNVITRAIGAEDYLDIDFFTSDLHRGDLILMCSDGLTNMLEDEEILEILQRELPLEEKGRILVESANRSGGTDNISVILADAFA